MRLSPNANVCDAIPPAKNAYSDVVRFKNQPPQTQGQRFDLQNTPEAQRCSPEYMRAIAGLQQNNRPSETAACIEPSLFFDRTCARQGPVAVWKSAETTDYIAMRFGIAQIVRVAVRCK